MINKDDLLSKSFLAIVEAIDINGSGITGKKKGRIKARIERFHGKNGEPNSISTQDIPWASPTLDGRGNTFFTPALEKVVRITFLEGDYYKPIYDSTEHYNFNLQEKLNSLSDDSYKNFYAVTYDDKHQYFHDIEMGVMFDYVKSNINIDPDGNMALNLRDNNAKLYLGTDEAYERIMLGEKWLKLFDSLVENLMGSKGGPYLGNLGAPVIPNPGLLQCLNEYLTHRKLKDTFLSDHVYVVDDKQVKAQTRQFDKAQLGDTWNSRYQENKKTPESRGYTAEERPPSAETGKGVPGTNISKNLANSNLPPNPTNEELQKVVKPFDGNENGRLDVNKLTISKYGQKAFPDGEQKYLIDEVATSLDKWLDAYHSTKQSTWSNITVSKGYQNFERQQNIREQFGPRSPEPGKDPFGFANQIELYWGVDLIKNSATEPLINYLNGNKLLDNVNVQILDWLVKNGRTYKWRLAGRDGDGNQQFSHWIYDATIIVTAPVAI